MIHKLACYILNYTSKFFHVDGAINGMSSSTPLQVVNAAVKITDPYGGNSFIAVINQALLIDDDGHVEALLQPHQARDFGTAIDKCAKHHKGVDGKLGKQCIKTLDAIKAFISQKARS